MHNVLELREVTKSYPGFQLGPLTLGIPRGAITGYIGENGAGKSTTIRLILDILRPESGYITLFGQVMAEDPRGIRDRIGIVFDDLHLPGDLTVRQAGIFCRKAYAHWDEPLFQGYRQQFALPENKKLKELSRGMKMKMQLAIALSHHAELLLLDEATSGLDPIVREELLDILQSFIQNEKNSVLISSHILSDLEKAADYIAFIHKGQLIFMEEKDLLRDEYALCQCDRSTADSLLPDAIIGRRSSRFGEQILMKRSLSPDGLELERPSIEEIMMFFIKGKDDGRLSV